jgi:hypothetical protein
MKFNKSPVSLREGKVFIDGTEVMDSVKCTITFTPETWSGKQLGERSDSTRWLGYKVAGSITRRRTTPFLKEIITRYQKAGATPEATIQGIMNDENSDYYTAHGSQTYTAVGCVFTGDLTLLSLDSAGDILDDVISFNAKDLV